MGNCQNDNTTGELANEYNMEGDSPVRRHGTNPFFEQDASTINHDQILSRYQFHSQYNDDFMGKCSVLEERTTGNLYLCKEMQFSDEEKMR